MSPISHSWLALHVRSFANLPPLSVLAHVSELIRSGREVRILTGLVHPVTRPIFSETALLDLVDNYEDADHVPDVVKQVRQWSLDCFGQALPITCVVDSQCSGVVPLKLGE